MDYIYLRVGRVRPGGGEGAGCKLQGQFDFFARGAMGGGIKTNLNKKEGGSRQIFFLYNLRPDYFFFQMGG